MNELKQNFFELTELRLHDVTVIVVWTLAAGALNACLPMVLAEAVTSASRGEYAPRLMWLFVSSAIACITLQQLSARAVVRATERACAEVRAKIFCAVREADLATCEATGAAPMRTLTTADATRVAEAIPSLVALLGSAVTAVGTLGYLLWLSIPTAVLVCVVVLPAVVLFRRLAQKLNAGMRGALAATDGCLAYADDLFSGGKELKLEPEFSQRFMRDDLLAALDSSRKLTTEARVQQQSLGLIATATFFGLLGLVVFVLGRHQTTDPRSLVPIVVTLLFLQAHVHAIVQRLPMLGESAHAVRRILDLTTSLRRGADRALAPASHNTLPVDWTTLHLSGVCFSYGNVDASTEFQLHNVTLDIPKGSTVFIVGGNGSGKTTLAKVLLGLYQPSKGHIAVDDVIVDEANLLEYRQYFAAVFSDAHLFRRRLADMPQDYKREMDQLLKEFNLKLSTSSDGRLDVRPYSQGQRRRVASALSLAQSRQICVFDEWAANQDPEYRKFFYLTFLPRLKLQGITLFVITHDDRFFGGADMVVYMNSGSLARCERKHDTNIVAAA